MATYGFVAICRIARALRIDQSLIVPAIPALEAAAWWYRMACRRPRRPPPSMLARKANNVAKAARRLLLRLGIVNPQDAIDGPGDPEIQQLLASVEGRDDDIVMTATARIGRLVELFEGIEAVNQVRQDALKGAQDSLRIGRLIIPRGHHGNDPVNDWIAMVLPIYEQITGNKPGVSVGAIGRKNEGKAGGPLLRFLAAAGHPLKIRCKPASWRSRVRRVLPGRPKK
jgi:hypothetical protein